MLADIFNICNWVNNNGGQSYHDNSVRFLKYPTTLLILFSPKFDLANIS